LGLLASSLAACGGDPSQPVTLVGQKILIPATDQITLDNPGGGFTPAPPAGSKCLVGGRTFSVAMATGDVTFTKCIGDGIVPYMPMSGSRRLSDADFKDLKALLEKLTVVKSVDACLADAPMLTVTVKTATASQAYIDDGFSCSIKDKPFLARSAISEAMSKLDTLTK
jgi:hypothetical protein